MMASKLDNSMNKAILFQALFGLLVGVIARTYFQGMQQNVDSKLSLRENLDELAGTMERSIKDGFVTLAIKFLHFFISKCLQLRYLPSLLVAPPAMYLMFWVVFTRSISSMPNNPL